MFKGRAKGRIGAGNDSVQKVPLKGLFSDGIWKCNCDPRLPAQRFQTKNGGKNHGRWFYTCQLPQLKRCDFWLWQDEAKAREVAVVFKNAASEPLLSSHSALITPPTTIKKNHSTVVDHPEIPFPPSTPSKSSGNFQPLVQSSQSSISTIKETAGEEDDDENEEFYDWPSSGDEELGKAASSLPSNLMPPPPTTPRKATKTDVFSTPGKRSNDNETTSPIPITKLGFSTRKPIVGEDDVFTTATTAMPQTPGLFSNYNNNNLPIPTETPTLRRLRDSPGGQDSDLATQVLQAFDRNKVSLSSELKDEVRAIANRHNMYTRGVVNGRDISRAMIKKKAEEIVELQGTIAGLESEREAQYFLIRSLRQELVQR